MAVTIPAAALGFGAEEITIFRGSSIHSIKPSGKIELPEHYWDLLTREVGP